MTGTMETARPRTAPPFDHQTFSNIEPATGSMSPRARPDRTVPEPDVDKPGLFSDADHEWVAGVKLASNTERVPRGCQRWWKGFGSGGRT